MEPPGNTREVIPEALDANADSFIATCDEQLSTDNDAYGITEDDFLYGATCNPQTKSSFNFYVSSTQKIIQRRLFIQRHVVEWYTTSPHSGI